MFSVQLLEADVVGVLPEALTAHVQVVLANQAVPKKTGKLETFKTKYFLLLVGASSAGSRSLAVLPRPTVPNVVVTHFSQNR